MPPTSKLTTAIQATQSPPRYLLGASLLFWGMMMDRPLLGAFFALLIESAHWVKFRWDFSEAAVSRAWQFNTIAIGLVSVLIFLDESAYMALPSLLTWLPALFLPMQFVQSFGLKNSIPLNTFSFFSRQRQQRNLRLGLTEESIHIHFGNVYFISALVAATLGKEANTLFFSPLYLPCLLLLTGWRLLATRYCSSRSLIFGLLIAGVLALAGQTGLDQLNNWIGNRGASRSPFNPNSTNTSIGRPGTIQLSPDIVWRLRTIDQSPKPSLLKTATYNAFHGSIWSNQRIAASNFDDLDNIEPSLGEIFYLINSNQTPENQREAISPSLPRFQLRGSAFAETPLPLPGNTSSLRDFELDGIERNSLGTVRVYPKHSIIQGTVLWNSQTPDLQPIPKEDFVIPANEREILQQTLNLIGVDQLPTLAAKLNAIRTWFQENFTYSKTLTISSTNFTSDPRSPIHQFLTTNRSGHCEYFATATALLLRKAGIPARYAVGYSVVERDFKRQEYNIRGTHGHAWCRVWDKERSQWIDFDTTPSSGLLTDVPKNTWTQYFNDSLKRLREDFFLWRNQSVNRLASNIVMISITLGVIGFIMKRLWKSKKILETEKKSNGYRGSVIQTPLNAIEPKAEKKLGPRRPSEPLAKWLARLQLTSPDSEALNEAIELHQRLRFDPKPASLQHQERLSELSRQLESSLKRP